MNKLLSIIILTKNEETNIKNAIKNIKQIASEILIIDDDSIDKTRKIAEKLGAKVFKKKLEDFSKQRNFGLEKAKGDWVLFIDADEIVSDNLAKEIIKVVEEDKYNGFYLFRTDIFLGKELKYGEAGNLALLRLAKKGSGKWIRKVHEAWNIKEEVGLLKNRLYHNAHRTVTDFVNSVNSFSTLHVEANIKEGKKSSVFKIVLWPTGKFIYNYIFKLGFLDGVYGFVYAVTMSFHSFLAWSKQWIIENK